MKQKKKTKKGFSLIETLIAVFVFSMAMVMFAGVFANLMKNYAQAKRTQKNIENAEYAMNQMAKTIRTSKLVTYSSSFPLRVYDFTTGSCIHYEYISPNISIASAATAVDDCTAGATLGAASTFADNIASANISATPTGTSLGKVTVSLIVRDDPSSVPIQMTVSLRQ